MKKLISLILFAAMLASLFAGSAAAESAVEPYLDVQLLLNQDGYTVIAHALRMEQGEHVINLEITNDTAQKMKLSIRSARIGNIIMPVIVTSTLSAGKKATELLRIKAALFRYCGITEISELQLNVELSDEASGKTIFSGEVPLVFSSPILLQAENPVDFPLANGDGITSSIVGSALVIDQESNGMYKEMCFVYKTEVTEELQNLTFGHELKGAYAGNYEQPCLGLSVRGMKPGYIYLQEAIFHLMEEPATDYTMHFVASYRYVYEILEGDVHVQVDESGKILSVQADLTHGDDYDDYLEHIGRTAEVPQGTEATVPAVTAPPVIPAQTAPTQASTAGVPTHFTITTTDGKTVIKDTQSGISFFYDDVSYNGITGCSIMPCDLDGCFKLFRIEVLSNLSGIALNTPADNLLGAYCKFEIVPENYAVSSQSPWAILITGETDSTDFTKSEVLDTLNYPVQLSKSMSADTSVYPNTLNFLMGSPVNRVNGICIAEMGDNPDGFFFRYSPFITLYFPTIDDVLTYLDRALA